MINNITIATADDITILSDDVNIYPGQLTLWVMILIGEKNAVVSDQYFFQFVVSHFGNSPMATECTFLYVCESWTLTAEIEKMRCYRRLLNISNKDHL